MLRLLSALHCFNLQARFHFNSIREECAEKMFVEFCCFWYLVPFIFSGCTDKWPKMKIENQCFRLNYGTRNSKANILLIGWKFRGGTTAGLHSPDRRSFLFPSLSKSLFWYFRYHCSGRCSWKFPSTRLAIKFPVKMCYKEHKKCSSIWMQISASFSFSRFLPRENFRGKRTELCW